MKIFDFHLHSKPSATNPQKLISELEVAGIFGGNVFSTRPKEANMGEGFSFAERISELHLWTDGYDGRLFPVLWIHPDEKHIKEKIRTACREGVRAFKVICNNFYPYEKKCLRMLSEIAAEEKPVIFHSGILWDSGASSKYNRPANFESLILIDGLRFSLGHCSWPWVDECIALYGKFLNGLTTGRSAEMFFDITPGTPKIYREELITKLFTVGYDVPNNIVFGTDNRADNYNSAWCKMWLDIDNAIYDKIGVTEEIKEKIYRDNFMRFLGISEKKVTHLSPVPDKEITWSIEYERERQ